MQQAANESKKEWAESGKEKNDRAVTEMKNIRPEDIRRAANEVTTQVRDASSTAYEETIGYVRQHPVQAALALGAVGLVLGLITGLRKKAA